MVQLRVKMPESCYDCFCQKYESMIGHYCGALKVTRRIKSVDGLCKIQAPRIWLEEGKRPDCPLKEVTKFRKSEVKKHAD